MSDLYMMRHGQTLFNAHKMIQGWCDSPLTDLGRSQALFAHNYFLQNKIVFDHAYCSTSERASDTLEIVTGNNMPYTRLKELKEWNFGKYEGQSENINPPLPYNDFFKKYAGGESQSEVENRIVGAVTSIMQKANHNTVLIVTHGGSLANFARHFDANALEGAHYKSGIPNCSIFHYLWDGNTFTCTSILSPSVS